MQLRTKLKLLFGKLGKKISVVTAIGLPWWFSGKESACQCRRCEFDPCVGKIP